MVVRVAARVAEVEARFATRFAGVAARVVFIRVGVAGARVVFVKVMVAEVEARVRVRVRGARVTIS
jgi:hypothetical protein